MRSFWAVILCCGIGVWIHPVSGQSPCPGEIAPIEYQPLEHSQIGVPVMINGQGPYVFMLDTGAQITIADPTLASILGLRPESSIGIISVARYAEASLFSVDSLGVGQYRVSNLRVAAQSLDQIRAVNRKVQGIPGEDFLAGFDLLINYAHRYICLDDTGRMQQAILGQRISTLGKEAIQKSRVVQPVLVPLHISGHRERETIVRLDSGSNAPVLFSGGGEILPWLQRMHASPGRISGTQKGIPFAAMPPQVVKLSDHLQLQIAFLTPIAAGTAYARAGEDGLLPTALFKEILISFRDHFVVFDPRDGCRAAESKRSVD